MVLSKTLYLQEQQLPQSSNYCKHAEGVVDIVVRI